VAAPARPDSAARASIDSVRQVPDSLRKPPVRRDSIQPPIARAELPRGVTAAPPYAFRGDTILATGALTLLDLLERVPGISGFRSGYVASTQAAAYNGDFRRVRVFRDGVELDPVNARNGNVPDLTDVSLWQGDELTSSSAGEVRVFASHARGAQPHAADARRRAHRRRRDQRLPRASTASGSATARSSRPRGSSSARVAQPAHRRRRRRDERARALRVGAERLSADVMSSRARPPPERDARLPDAGRGARPPFAAARDEGYRPRRLRRPEAGPVGAGDRQRAQLPARLDVRGPGDTSRGLPDTRVPHAVRARRRADALGGALSGDGPRAYAVGRTDVRPRCGRRSTGAGCR
jgi:hypothetical protein